MNSVKMTFYFCDVFASFHVPSKIWSKIGSGTVCTFIKISRYGLHNGYAPFGYNGLYGHAGLNGLGYGHHIGHIGHPGSGPSAPEN